VAPDDLICVAHINLPVGATLEAPRVLLVGEAGATVIGSPVIEGARVHATVEEQGKGEKVIIFKKRRRKGYRRWNGHRAKLTLLRIGAIELPDALETQLSSAS
jgi:large subunit ribosomal protein L21